MATKGTVKLVADIEPSLKAAFDRKAKQAGLTLRAAVEQALRDYVRGQNEQGS